MPEYTAETLWAYVRQWETEPRFQNWHARLDNWRRLRWREEPVRINGVAEILEYRTAGLSAHVDRYRNRVHAADINIKALASSSKQADLDAAQRVENFLYRLYYDLRRQRTDRVAFVDERADDYQVADGLGPRHIDWRPDVLESIKLGSTDIKELRKAVGEGFHGNPFALRAPDVRSIYFADNFSTVCEVGPVRVALLRESYDTDEIEGFEDVVSDTLTSLNERQPGTVQFCHVETGDYIYEAIEGVNKNNRAIMRTLPNLAGRPRYTFAVGHVTSGAELWQQYRPLIHDLYALAPLINITGTLLTSGALQTGRLNYQEVKIGSRADDWSSIIERPAEDRNIITIDPAKGETVPQPRDGYEMKPIQPPDLGILASTHQQLLGEFESFGFPSIIGPEANVDASSGYDRAKQQEGAQDFLEPPLKNKAAAWHELFLLAIEQLKAFDLPVTIHTVPMAEGEGGAQREITIKPGDFVDIDLEVSFRSIPATVQFGMDEAARRDVELGYESKSRYMASKWDDPISEREQVALDRVDDMAEQKALEYTAMFLDAMAPQVAEDVATDLGLPSPARPERPVEPEPGLGAPIAPAMQSEPGAPVPPNTPATGGGSVGVAQ